MATCGQRVEGAIPCETPDAKAVRVNFWSGPKLDMEKQSDGFWTVTTPPLVPGFHYYTLVIDGWLTTALSTIECSAEVLARGAVS